MKVRDFSEEWNEPFSADPEIEILSIFLANNNWSVFVWTIFCSLLSLTVSKMEVKEEKKIKEEKEAQDKKESKSEEEELNKNDELDKNKAASA